MLSSTFTQPKLIEEKHVALLWMTSDRMSEYSSKNPAISEGVHGVYLSLNSSKMSKFYHKSLLFPPTPKPLLQ